jgi:hypothetical protein
MTQAELSHELLALSKVLLETEQPSGALYSLSEQLQILSRSALDLATRKSRLEVSKKKRLTV